jgi:ATP-dependent exoDNAse (exonuclease V) alpha subunit
MNHKIILGAAGTGKSYECNQQLKHNPYFCYRTSTTGTSALNMLGDTLIIESNSMKTGGGRTINSALGYSDTASLLRDFSKGSPVLKRNLKNIAEHYERLAIDEVFMLGATELDIIYSAITQHNADVNNNTLYLYLMGDCGQLPPINSTPIFQSLCWDKLEKVYLTEVKRQNNIEFITVLNKIRKGEIKDCKDWLVNNILFEDTLNEDFKGITVMTTNQAVNAFNTKKLTELRNRVKEYKANKEGNPGPLWGNTTSSIPKSIFLAVGARVMVTCNNLLKGYANGSLGVISKLENDTIYVVLDSNQEEVPIKKVTNKNYSLDGTELGSVTFFPIKLAWATTLYKLQGLTIKGKLQAVITKDKFLKTLHGGLYTLLSRMVSSDDLVLIGNVDDLIQANFINKDYLPYIK